MNRINEGYSIITAIPTGKDTEIVIGHALNPHRPAQYVVWDCKGKCNYNNGGYTMNYRQALEVLANRIKQYYDFLPVDAPAGNPDEEKAELLVPLFARQIGKSEDMTEPPIAVQTAVQTVAEDLYCDLKFDHDLLIRWFDLNGWTEDDRDYFGISQMFDETKEE